MKFHHLKKHKRSELDPEADSSDLSRPHSEDDEGRQMSPYGGRHKHTPQLIISHSDNRIIDEADQDVDKEEEEVRNEDDEYL